MATENKTLAVIELFTENRPVWTADEVACEIGISISTSYRYIKELCASGFLDSVRPGSFALGPAFIQYDYRMRRNDTLIQHAAPHMRQLIEDTDPRSDIVLSRLFNNCVLCIHQENGPEAHEPTRYVRGVAMPLFVGATSRVILAHLPDRTLKRLYLDNEAEIRARSQEQTWKAFKQDLRTIRKDGYCLTVSEVSKGQAGLAAPIFRGESVVGSVSFVAGEASFENLRAHMDLVARVKSCAAKIEASI
ncbi:MAG: IclR family transcriptional regulator [Confluentimicrobium sp.]|jgi:DNA-binding IclR family transcriptional regulator|uniref:IclR family transcriptional regulator n=1 Tax=Actibacterium sp. TaxID=1872125 RepID=UPI000C445CD0|nr:IclR family transcriptional regulator C-terminal domain-containing protein [Actibacterium sp.]MBC57522.1 IclR family transcriptional regulator [Actibacterium sp.]|tara:strand:+ start:7036 stop:7779 length:744 start_codon:yes stop_codon:yes gene_type:complete